MKRLKNRQAFTLLEVLISITILALMALMISRIFSESTRAVERGKDQSQTDEAARRLLDYIEQDISQAVIRTNVPFRVETVGENDALYFVSTAVRRQLESSRRDTGPVRWQAPISAAGVESDLNQTLSLRSPGAAESDAAEVKNLIQQSRASYDAAGPGDTDFQEGFYTQPLEPGQSAYAVVSFLDVIVNADPESSRAAAVSANDRPRFVDVIIGLISSTDMARAVDLQQAGNMEQAERLIDQYETLYSRRIFMRNRGVE